MIAKPVNTYCSQAIKNSHFYYNTEKEKRMTGEQLQAMRDRMDNQFIDSAEEADEFELEERPIKEHSYYPTYAIGYYTKLAGLYSIQEKYGEDKALKTAEEDYENGIKDLKEFAINKKYRFYFETLGFVHACKDYLEGEA